MTWPESLRIVLALPTPPLWLTGDRVVPLNLEASHTAACIDLRIALEKQSCVACNNDLPANPAGLVDGQTVTVKSNE